MSTPIRTRADETCLASLELRNFKSVRHCDVPFSPLTVVTGANSSGKSSLLQAVLALAQASRRSVSGGRFPLNDDLVSLGTFGDLRHQRADAHEPVTILISFRVSMSDARRAMLDAPFESRRSVSLDRFVGINSELPICVRWSTEIDTAFRGQMGSARISALAVSAEADDSQLLATVQRAGTGATPERLQVLNMDEEYDNYLGAFFLGPSSIRVDEARLEGARINTLLQKSPGFVRARENLAGWLRCLGTDYLHPELDLEHIEVELDEGNIDNASLVDLRFECVETMEENLREGYSEYEDPHDYYWSQVRDAATNIRMGRSVTADFSKFVYLFDQEGIVVVAVDLFHALETQLEQIRNRERSDLDPLPGSDDLLVLQDLCGEYLSTLVRYVGPLRHAPDTPFAMSPDPDSGYVGTSGEHVAAVLQAKRSIRDDYPQPIDERGPDSSDQEITLEEATNRWLGYLGLATAMNVEESTPRVLGINITPIGLGDTVPLGSVGVGVSQALPVIVQCLVAGPGALVILEQPELHLHPAAQQRLADFLIACTRWGQRFLIESHSEHLVLRLRRRIAEDPTDSLRDQVAILFAERDDRGDTAYRQIEVTEAGGVVDWPDGFFDQGPEDAHQLLVAAANRQRRSDEADDQ